MKLGIRKNDELAKSYVRKVRRDKASLWKKRTPLLKTLEIELTERCNNNCIHCYINKPENDYVAQNNELSTMDIKRILEEAVFLGCLRVKFTGGEPLLREDFEEIYLFARKLGLKVSILTNATLITDQLVKLFERIPPMENISITLYGIHAFSYEAVTHVPGSFEAAWQGMNRLLDKNIPFDVKSVLLPQNETEMEEFDSLASGIPWMSNNVPFISDLNLRGRRDSERKNLVIKNLRRSPESIIKFLTKDPEKYIKEMKSFCKKFLGPHGKKLFACGAGLEKCCVDAYGQFQLCMFVRHPDTVYDLKNGTLREALENFAPKIRLMEAKNHEYLNHCSFCFLKSLCNNCPGKSWMEHGTLDTPVEYLCDITHLQAKYLGLLEEGEKSWKVKDWRERIKRLNGI